MAKMQAVVLAAVVAAGSSAGVQRAGTQADSRRVNAPLIPFALEPLQWGAVTPKGWIKDWSVAATKGAVSPENAAFAHVHNGMPGLYVRLRCYCNMKCRRGGGGGGGSCHSSANN